jgi:hypothetical protein
VQAVLGRFLVSRNAHAFHRKAPVGSKTLGHIDVTHVLLQSVVSAGVGWRVLQAAQPGW